MTIENKDQLIDIYDIWYEPFWMKSWFYTLIMLTVLGVSIVVCYYLYKKYMQKTAVVDCQAIAYKNLDSLKDFHIVTLADSKDCYFKLSLIIKKYLACRYDVLIFPQLTDNEITTHAALYMHDDQVNQLKNILQKMTFIKFEHEIAATEKFQKDIQLIQEFIHNTSPRTKEN